MPIIDTGPKCEHCGTLLWQTTTGLVCSGCDAKVIQRQSPKALQVLTSLDKYIECPECQGMKKVECDECKGTGDSECWECGHVDDCDECGGDGKHKCDKCDGTGVVVKRWKPVAADQP